MKKKLTAVQVAESVVAEIRLNRHPSSLDDYSEVSTNIYENKTTYPEYEITIEVKSGPVELNRALISVRSLSDTDIKGSPFTTEMYFEVTP